MDLLFIRGGGGIAILHLFRTCVSFSSTCYHPPPGNPREKSGPSGPGVGNCLKQSCPGVAGCGKSAVSRFTQRGEDCLFARKNLPNL